MEALADVKYKDMKRTYNLRLKMMGQVIGSFGFAISGAYYLKSCS